MTPLTHKPDSYFHTGHYHKKHIHVLMYLWFMVIANNEMVRKKSGNGTIYVWQLQNVLSFTLRYHATIY